jgi:glycine dehydrogenase
MASPSAYTPSTYDPYDFANRRHIGPSPEEMAEMLRVVGAPSLDALIDETVPEDIRDKTPLEFGRPLSERGILDRMRATAAKNRVLTSLIGQGYHGTIMPPAIQRNILENPAWYTAYTPYQAEISQGRLEALLNFQTLVSDLTGLDVANASLLDEATAAAEAMALAHRVTKSKANAFFVDEMCLPQTIAVLRTRAEPLGWEIFVGDPFKDLDPEKVFGALFQYPGVCGTFHEFSSLIEKLHAAKAIAVVAADPLALTLLKPPGEMGADVAIGSMQRFGMPMGYGGPHAAYIAVKDAYKRALPGRIVGVSVDARGNRAYRLALQTREQHIRRETATSNICTAQVLPAVIASMYAVFHGPKGLKAIAERVHRKAVRLADGLASLGFKIAPDEFFDTITVEVGPYQGLIMKNAVDYGVNLRKVGHDRIGITVDERTRPATLEAVWRAFGGYDLVYRDEWPAYRLPKDLIRQSAYLTNPVFHMNRAESEMTRYMRRLADRDLALDRAMIPLGSCTMKLNATAEMLPITWPEFAELHPFVPADQARGYAELIEDLSKILCQITGYDAISMQPNSGAQGEYAGLLTIRAYHRSRGDTHRDICLIPASAHGTNPASATMCGMKVVVVATDERGNIDLADFRAKAEGNAANLAAAMITYPSTHGVFEETVREICAITHANGGQVYLDGANMNALVGLARPGDIGADVGHLNLHKTFCIPHGGGGPGMGPIGVKAHLVPFLPGHPEMGGGGVMTVSAAPYGSASILAIPWSYCLMMGGAGLTQATRVAILNANYIAKRLGAAYEVLYTGKNGRVAHECIVDTRPLNEKAGVTVDDVAKRLIDCGFHPPTMSWPVAGTLMIEPTESETKAELDRFCDAMLAIREEARAIEEGRMDKTNNPLKNAPHTVEDLVGEWNRPYSREEACFPAGAFRVDKYWPPVNRIDNAYGDRHLVCVCPPIEAYAKAAE